jgi:hypothetical protein
LKNYFKASRNHHKKPTMMDNNTRIAHKDNTSPWNHLYEGVPPISHQMDRRMFAANHPQRENYQPFVAPAYSIASVKEETKGTDTSAAEVEQAHIVASGAAGCFLGCMVGGMLCAILGGAGATYAAKNKKGTLVGDCARATGEVALVAQSKAKELNNKHHIVTGVKEIAVDTALSLNDLDNQYNIGGNVVHGITKAGTAVCNFFEQLGQFKQD